MKVWIAGGRWLLGGIGYVGGTAREALGSCVVSSVALECVSAEPT